MITMGITPRVELIRTPNVSVGYGFAVAARDSLVDLHNVSDPQWLKTMIDGQA